MAEKKSTGSTRKTAAQKKADKVQAEQTVKVGSHEDAKAAEVAGKEASVPPSDPRESVTDHAPGKTLKDVQTRKAEHEAGEHQDEEEEVREPQYFVADEDNLTLIDVARRLGLHNHSELGAINGMSNGVYALQKGQKVLLPNSYDFSGVDSAVEGYKAPSKEAGGDVAKATGTTTPPEVITDPTVEAKAAQDGVEKIDDYDLKREDVDAAK